MQSESPELAKFQTDLSGRGQARISIPVADQVIGSISLLDDKSSAQISRDCNLNAMTANRYVRGEGSPRLVVLARMLSKLGYSLYIVKDPE